MAGVQTSSSSHAIMSLKALLLLAALAYACAQQLCPSSVVYNYYIKGAGASTLGPLFTNLIYAYRNLQSDVCITYAPSGSGSGRAQLLNNSMVQFAGSNTIFPISEVSSAVPKQLWSLASSSSSTNLCYNLTYNFTIVRIAISRSSLSPSRSHASRIYFSSSSSLAHHYREKTCLRIPCWSLIARQSY